MLCIDGKLAGDSTLGGLLAKNPPTGYAHSIYHDQAPADAPFPFVILSKSSGIPTPTMGDPSAYETDIWLVKAIDHNMSADGAEAICARCQALLNDATLSISGGTLLFCRRQSDVDYAEMDAGEVYRHSGSTYRLVYE